MCVLCHPDLYIHLWTHHLFTTHLLHRGGEPTSHPKETNQEDCNDLARLIARQKQSQTPPAQGKRAGNIQTKRRYKPDETNTIGESHGIHHIWPLVGSHPARSRRMNEQQGNPLLKALEAALLAALGVLIKEAVNSMQTPPPPPKEPDAQ